MITNNQVMLKEGAFLELPAGKGILIGSKCPRCELVHFPQVAVCPACLQVLPEEGVEIGDQGQIEAFTVSHVAPEGFRAPYVQAYVRLKDGPKIFSLIDVDLAKVSSLYKGMKVELKIKVIGKDVEGSDILGWTYRPVSGDE